ncbi:DUF3352 domain-containing protein [Pantanalinema rosaneae CENA516]|uniref:DUF3352 domain-containing protein n=1 Tax=Pantanalinema rosaneae TaxID=1620701 RepID=UPI003D6F6BF1
MAGKKFLLPIVGAAVIAAGGVAAYLYLKSPSKDIGNPLASAEVVPDKAYMAAFISTNENSWAKLRQFGTPEAQKLVNQGLQDLQKEMLQESKLDYEKDLKPWIGNVMIAVLPEDPQTKNDEPDALIVVGIKDKVAALNFAKKMESQGGVKSTKSDYKGVEITQFTSAEKGSPTYAAVLQDFLVMAGEKRLVEKAIDTSKGGPSLASKPDAKAALTKNIGVQNPVATLYLLDYGNAIQELIANNPEAGQLPPATLEQVKQVKSVVAGVGIDDSGIRLKALANLNQNAKTITYKPAPGTVVSLFPTETFALVSGAGISQVWSQATEQINATPEGKQVLDQMRMGAGMVNLDLDKDVFGWMDGEFGIGMVPSNQGLLAQVGFGGVMMFDTSDRKTAENTFKKLDELVQAQGVTVGQRDVQGKSVTEWTAPGAGALVGHGWLDNDTVFVAIGGALVDMVANKPSQALDSSDSFKTVTGSLPKQNLGYFYLDMDRTMNLMKGTVLASQSSAIPPETMAVLNSIRGVGMTSSQPDKTTGELELLLALKPANK